ncbi:hypothetical protein FHS15_004801 [Paenibacillus castaneae]|uniref:hypothetical protein n=1 Tax=Paenibacillus castaneae TaxID=474957 RepID=UPI000C9B6D66|nr:hypothetical protein [Paenibacillus castaneae]NIK79640.1 hypothetical protein [Paenibacillus castaneae]
MEDNQKRFTNNYLQFCYTCLEAHQCDEESKCVACWEKNGIDIKEGMKDEVLDETKDNQTEDLLKLYAL